MDDNSVKDTSKGTWIPQLIAILMLLWALNHENPYGYYRQLRVVCCAVFVYLCVRSINLKQQGWAWVTGVTAFVYNPLMPLHLSREIWTVVNIITILIAGASIFWLKQGGGRPEGS